MLAELKRRLRILDSDEDELLQGIILQGKSDINDLMGAELNYETEGAERSLLLEYCRYTYNNALEYFEDNLRKSIVRLQIKVALKHDQQENEGTATP